MSILYEMLEANKLFVKRLPEGFINYHTSSKPCRQVAILTCMDTRLVDFLEPALGIRRGEAKVIKNAGNSIIEPFDTTIRSLVMSIFKLDVNEIVVIGHLDCGMANTTSENLIEAMERRGISADAIKMIEKDLKEWIDHFYHPEFNVEKVVAKIRVNPLIPKSIPVHGLIFNPHSGGLRVVVDGYQTD